MTCFVIAEAGVNHNGSDDIAMQLVDVAASARADAVKFQTFRADRLVRAGAKKAPYQRRWTGDGDQFSMLQSLELSSKLHERLAGRCAELGIEFLSTPFDVESARFLVELGVKRMKVPSGEVTNHPLLEQLATFGLPIIMSTGMATLDEVKSAVAVIGNSRKRAGLDVSLSRALTLLHCTSTYPAILADVNLLAMHTLRNECGVPVGYSDHTRGTLVAPLAVAMGATVIEKHFTMDRNLPGPDHAASLEPRELGQMIAAIRETELAMGSGIKVPAESELTMRALMRRSVTLRRAVRCGEVLKREDLDLLRPADGISPSELNNVTGKRVVADLPAGHALTWSDLEP